MSDDDRFGDLGPQGSPEPAKGAAERWAELDITNPEPDMPPRRPVRPEVVNPGNKYVWLVGLVMLMGIGVLALTSTLPNSGAGIRGPEVGKIPPAFAAPGALSDFDDEHSDVNLFQTAEDAEDAGVPHACAVHGDGVINSCDMRDKPLVVTFVVTDGADCEPQVDRVERMRGEYENVRFVTVMSGEKRSDVEKVVRRRGWGMPVAVDKDGGLINAWGIGVCPSTVFAYAGGRVRTTKLGNLTEDELRAETEAIVRGPRKRPRRS